MFPPSLMDQLSPHNGRGRGLNSSSSALGPGTPDDRPERDLSTNKYCCSRCGRSYQHQATLVRHQRYECGIQASYPCDICNRKFKRRDVLKGHKEKCVNKVQAQAALASMAGGPGGGPTTPGGTPRTMSPPPSMISAGVVAASVSVAENSASPFRSELHHTF